jgi:hypothetical protein
MHLAARTMATSSIIRYDASLGVRAKNSRVVKRSSAEYEEPSMRGVVADQSARPRHAVEPAASFADRYRSER